LCLLNYHMHDTFTFFTVDVLFSMLQNYLDIVLIL
jgi:hypothetical protein